LFPVHALGFALDGLIGQSGVPLRRRDRCVPQDLLQCGQISSRLEPLARELVPQLVRMEPGESGRRRTALPNTDA